MNPPTSGLTAGMLPHLGEVCLALALLTLLALIMAWRNARALAQTRAHYNALVASVAEGDLESLLNQHLERIQTARREVDALERTLASVARQADGCVQRIGLVRYDAFGDVHGDVSFALALLDQHGNGVLVNSMFARQGSSVYAKQIRAGRAEVPLSDEESEALTVALRQPSVERR